MSDAAPSLPGKPVDPARSLVAPPNVRRDWLVLLGLILATSAVFAFSNLDITLASLFYHPGLDDPWPEQQRWLWRLLNHYGPWPGGLLAIAGVAVLVLSAVKPAWERWRLHALAVVLTVVIGPGLLVNVVCKDHWGRPRPRDIVELGGTHAFRPPVIPDFGAAGKAFPCGHSSMGFVFFILFLIFRRSRPRLAWCLLAGSVAWGLLIGVARMSAGGHFATDVLWSAWIPVAVALVVYHGILRIPAWEDRVGSGSAGPAARMHPGMAVAAVVIGAGMLVSLIAATPVDRKLAAVQVGAAPTSYDVNLAGGPLELTVSGDEGANIVASLDGTAEGFGFPGAGVETGMVLELAPEGIRAGMSGSPSNGSLNVVVHRHGWFTELVTRVHLHLHPGLGGININGTRFIAPAGAFAPITIFIDDQGRPTTPYPPWTVEPVASH